MESKKRATKTGDVVRPVIKGMKAPLSSILKVNANKADLETCNVATVAGDAIPSSGSVQQSAGKGSEPEAQEERCSSSRRVSFANTCQVQEFVHEPIVAWKTDKNKDGSSQDKEMEFNHEDEPARENIDPDVYLKAALPITAANDGVGPMGTDLTNLLTGEIRYLPLQVENSSEDSHSVASMTSAASTSEFKSKKNKKKVRPARRHKRDPLAEKDVSDANLIDAGDGSLMVMTLNRTIRADCVGLETVHFMDSEANMDMTCVESQYITTDQIPATIASPKLSLADVFKTLRSSAEAVSKANVSPDHQFDDHDEDDPLETNHTDTIVLKSAPSPFGNHSLDLENVSLSFADRSYLPVCSTWNPLQGLDDNDKPRKMAKTMPVEPPVGLAEVILPPLDKLEITLNRPSVLHSTLSSSDCAEEQKENEQIHNISKQHPEQFFGDGLDSVSFPEDLLTDMDTTQSFIHTSVISPSTTLNVLKTNDPPIAVASAVTLPQKQVKERFSLFGQKMQLMEKLGLCRSPITNQHAVQNPRGVTSSVTSLSSDDKNVSPLVTQSDENTPEVLDSRQSCSDPEPQCSSAIAVVDDDDDDDDEMNSTILEVEMREMMGLANGLLHELDSVCGTLDSLIEGTPTEEECCEVERVNAGIKAKQVELHTVEEQYKTVKSERRVLRAREENLKVLVEKATAEKAAAIAAVEMEESVPPLYLFMEFIVHEWSLSEIHVTFLDEQLHYRFSVDVTPPTLPFDGTTGTVRGVTRWCEKDSSDYVVVDPFAMFTFNYMLRSHDEVQVSTVCSAGERNGVKEALQMMSMTAAYSRMLLRDLKSIRNYHKVTFGDTSVTIQFVDLNAWFLLTFEVAPRTYPNESMPFTMKSLFGNVQKDFLDETAAKVKPGVCYLKRLAAAIRQVTLTKYMKSQ